MRRVATLVAKGASRGDLFAVAAAEVPRVVGVPAVGILGYESDGTAVHLAGFASDVEVKVEVGNLLPLDGPKIVSEIRANGRAARIDDYAGVAGTIAEKVRSEGLRSAVGSPIIVTGRLWGAMVVYSPDPGALPRDTESRLADFTELLATAIANAESLEELHLLAEDQAALRRAATMVAEGLSPSEIFAAVCGDVGRLFDSEAGAIVRFEIEPPSLIVLGIAQGIPGLAVGTRSELREEFAASQVYRTGRSGRVDERDLESGNGPLLEPAAWLGLSSTVASPVVVDGRLWGAISVSANAPFPRGTEARLERFGELIATAMASASARDALERLAAEQAALRRVANLVVEGAPSGEIFTAVSAEVPPLSAPTTLTSMVATAIANADSKSELVPSRRRIAAVSDEARRRIERDLHDGTQQRLIALGLELRAAEADVPRDQVELRATLSHIETGLTDVFTELQEISRGIHPAILSQDGLSPAIRTLARRSPIAVNLDLATSERLPAPVEVATYYVVSEALANAAKHSGASAIEVALQPRRDGVGVVVSIRDDGVGGADPAGGSGLVGLTDRLEALGGSIRVNSPPGSGTHIVAVIPRDLDQATDDN